MIHPGVLDTNTSTMSHEIGCMWLRYGRNRGQAGKVFGWTGDIALSTCSHALPVDNKRSAASSDGGRLDGPGGIGRGRCVHHRYYIVGDSHFPSEPNLHNDR